MYNVICFDTIYTNFKFDLCINFDPEFLDLFKGAWHSSGCERNPAQLPLSEPKCVHTSFSLFSRVSIR